MSIRKQSLLESIVNGKSSGAPYIIWTGIFSSIGIRILRNRNVLDGFQTVAVEQNFLHEDVPDDIPRIRFCRKCGSNMLDGAKFCNKCGTEVIKEDNNFENVDEIILGNDSLLEMFLDGRWEDV